MKASKLLKLEYSSLGVKLICLIALIYSNSLVGQTHVDTYNELIEKNRGAVLDHKVDSLLTKYEGEGDVAALADIAHKYALFLRLKDINKALYYAEIEISAFESNGIVNEKYANALYNKGRFYYMNMEYEKAIFNYKKIIEIDKYKIWLGQARAELGRCYNKTGDFFRSVSNFKKGLKLLEELGENRLVASHYINLLVVYRSIDTAESMKSRLRVLEKADSLGQIVNLRALNKRTLIDAFANQYLSEFTYDFKKALTYYNQNLTDALKAQDSITIAKTYNNLANLYNLEKLDSSIYFAEQGLPFAKMRNVKAKLFDNIAEHHSTNNQLELALKKIHQALEVNLGTTLNLKSVPNKLQLGQLPFKKHALLCLKKKADILIKLYKTENDSGFLESAIANSLAADELITITQESNSEVGSKLVWRKEASKTYFLGAYASFLLNDYENYFSFMEKNKAFLLTQSIVDNTTFSSLPKNIADQETSLRRKVLELESELSESQKTELEKKFNTDLFNAKESHENFLDSIKQIYPGHFQNKLKIVNSSLSNSKRMLKKDEVLISFIWGKLDENNELILGLVTNGSTTKSFQLRYDKEFDTLLKQYRELVSRELLLKSDPTKFQHVAYEMYDKIFPSKAIKALIRDRNLLIIPDGDLQNIPFEALITNKRTNEYLIQSSDVSYLYSVSFLNYNDQRERKADRRFIGYAPVDFSESSLPNLINAGRELEAIDNILNGTIKLRKNATKKDFLDSSGPYKIIHLATHAFADDNPSIVFSDGLMTLNELYSFKCNADLVTLSACNTSLGTIAKGEGVLSLTRGFFYAGAKSVVSSLWNVDDQSTADIMTAFYANLKAGQNKSEALSNAKRTYLKSHSLSRKSPYYWSSFTLTGDTKTISL